MSAQVYREDGEIVIDKGGSRLVLGREEAADVARQLALTTSTPLTGAAEFEVQINGEYGDPEGSIHLLRHGQEVVMWDSAEWRDDPSLVFVIANAIRNRGVSEKVEPTTHFGGNV